MLLGDEGQISWEKVAYSVVGLIAGLVPGLWAYRLKTQEADPKMAASKQRTRSKDMTLDQEMNDHLFLKYKELIDGFESKLNKLEVDHRACEKENARLNERCDNQTAKISELAKVVENQGDRIHELEAQQGGL